MTDSDRASLLNLSPGQEIVIGGEIWFRMDLRNYKVSPEHEEPSDRNSFFVHVSEIRHNEV